LIAPVRAASADISAKIVVPNPASLGVRGARTSRIFAGVGADRRELIAIFVGGAVGAVARAQLEEALPHEPGDWPWATFAVNVAGALVLAWLTTRLTEMVAPTRYWRFLLGTGFCGALTTFSTFQIEVIELAREGSAPLAAAYATASLAAGMLVTAGATVAARRRRYG
jgi:CrcB protein